MTALSPRQRVVRIALDLTSGLLIQLTTLLAMLLIVWLGGLRNTAYFTFALAVCGPISLFAGMSLMELIFSGDERYRRTVEIGLAQTIVYCVLAMCAGVGISFWNVDYIPVFVIVACAKLAELLATFCFHLLRREGRFKELPIVGILQFLVFCLLATGLLWTNLMSVQNAVSLALLGAALFQMGVFMFLLRHELTTTRSDTDMVVSFIGRHIMRSIAISLNSVQSNLPRYALEVMYSPAHQAAFSLIMTTARFGTLLLQSIFVQTARRFRESHAEAPVRASLSAGGIFLAVSSILTAVMLAAWAVSYNIPQLRHLLSKVLDIVSFNDGLVLLITTGIYLCRFGIWQIVSLLDSGRRQTVYALLGTLGTGVASLSLIPALGLQGAAYADAIGNILLIVLPLIIWTRKPGKISA